jgi:hypothetical protein
MERHNTDALEMAQFVRPAQVDAAQRRKKLVHNWKIGMALLGVAVGASLLWGARPQWLR